MMDDDIRAIVQMFVDTTVRNSINAVVVTSGNVQVKGAVARKIIAGFGLKIPVYVGSATDLSNNDTTLFAANYELEGKGILSPKEMAAAKAKIGTEGRGAENLNRLFTWAKNKKLKMDVLLITAPTDLVKAINMDPALAKDVLADLFTMGLYKKNAKGELIAPFNTMVDPSSVSALLRLYDQGIFENFYHVPSDTVQQRSGLPGGYFPENEAGNQLKMRLAEIMRNNLVLSRILAAAREYGYNWRHSAARQFGIGVGTSIDRWVPQSFQDPDGAAGFYLADTIPSILSGTGSNDLKDFRFEQRSVQGPAFGTNVNVPFQLTERPLTVGRLIKDLIEFDGTNALKNHVALLEGANRFPPDESFYKQDVSVPKDRSSKRDKFNRVGKEKKALLLVFKNSPDDWFALMRILSTTSGRLALVNGGIVTEGFQTEKVKESIIKVLASVGINDIPVASGYQYGHSEVDSIPNFKGELAFNKLDQATRAFESLPFPADPGINSGKGFTANEIFERSAKWTDRNSSSIDAVILGEGIDLVRFAQKNQDFAEKLSNLYVMGGGRYDGSSGQLVLSRNWLPHSHEVISGLESIGRSGKKVFIFSSNDFGGSIVASSNKDLGNGKGAFDTLIRLAKQNQGFKSIQDHWTNWSRTFQWVLNPSQTSSFNPHSTVSNLSTSPIGLVIAEEWLRGDLETGTSKLGQEEVSLTNLLNSKKLSRGHKTGLQWLKSIGPLEVVPLAERFGISIERISQSKAAKAHDSAVRKLSILSDEAQTSWKSVGNESMNSVGSCRAFYGQ